MTMISHIVGGESQNSGRPAPVYNPATGAQAAEVLLGGANEVAAAVDAAAKAFPAWAATPPARRAEVMFNLRQIMRARADDIARTISAEHGKTHDDALGEVTRALEVVEFASGITQHLKGDFSREVARGVDSYAERAPLGVVAGITPFNFPSMVPLWMIPMALACGNSFVLKPSEKDPSSANLIHDMATRRQWMRFWIIPISWRSPSLAPRRSPNMSINAAARPANGCRRWAGRKTIW